MASDGGGVVASSRRLFLLRGPALLFIHFHLKLEGESATTRVWPPPCLHALRLNPTQKADRRRDSCSAFMVVHSFDSPSSRENNAEYDGDSL